MKGCQQNHTPGRLSDRNTADGPWVLVSELGHREGGAGVLGLGVCRGLMDEFKLLRMAFGAAELAREWAATAPRKPEEERAGAEWISGGPVQSPEPFLKLITRYTEALRK